MSPSDNDKEAMPAVATDQDKAPELAADTEAEAIPTLTNETTSGVDTPSSDAPVEPPASKPELNSSPKAAAKTPWLALFSLLLVLLLGAAGAWFWLQFQALQQQVANLPDPKTSLQPAIQKVDTRFEQLQSTLAASQQQRAVLKQQLAQLQQSHIALQRQLSELSSTDRADWQLAEVEYLLRLAHQRLMSTQRADLAIELLKAADEKLKELARADLWSVREQVAADIVALQMAARIDSEGLYLQVQALLAQIPNLEFQLDASKRLSDQSVPPAATDIAAQTWQDKLQASWQKLLNVYRVQKHDLVVKPLLRAEDIWLIQQRLNVRLLQAQQALMVRDETVFHSSLSAAVAVVSEHTVADSAINQLFQSQIQQLTEQAISTPLPDISGSHTALSDYTRAYRLEPQPAAQETAQ